MCLCSPEQAARNRAFLARQPLRYFVEEWERRLRDAESGRGRPVSQAEMLAWVQEGLQHPDVAPA